MDFWGSSILGLKVTGLLQSAPQRHLTCKRYCLACSWTSIEVPSHQHTHSGSPQKSVSCNVLSLLTWFTSLPYLLALPNAGLTALQEITILPWGRSFCMTFSTHFLWFWFCTFPTDSETFQKHKVAWMLFVNWLAYFCVVAILQFVEPVACKLHGWCRFHHHLYQNNAPSHFSAAKSYYLHNRKLIQFHIYRDPTVM
jgi:hypothetical protein